MKKLKNTKGKVLIYMLIALIAIGGTTSCKSKKKLAREKAAAEYASKVAKAKKDLLAILNDETNWTLEEKKTRLEDIINENFKEQEIKDLIGQVKEKLKKEVRMLEEEKLRKKENEMKEKEQSKYSNIVHLFNNIAQSTNYDNANTEIDKTMELFATPDIPVLIIISKAGGFNDYDRPTTIAKFMDYLKDVKKFNYNIESVKYNDQGKITELELIKK